jgi:hypothetical protein
VYFYDDCDERSDSITTDGQVSLQGLSFMADSDVSIIFSEIKLK